MTEAILGSPDRVGKTIPWLLEVMAVTLSFKREDIRSEGFLETLKHLNRLDDDLTRYVFALDALNGLLSIHGNETLRSHFDSLHETLKRRIEGDGEPPRQGR